MIIRSKFNNKVINKVLSNNSESQVILNEFSSFKVSLFRPNFKVLLNDLSNLRYLNYFSYNGFIFYFKGFKEVKNLFRGERFIYLVSFIYLELNKNRLKKRLIKKPDLKYLDNFLIGKSWVIKNE
jgi:hypothetical protein